MSLRWSSICFVGLFYKHDAPSGASGDRRYMFLERRRLREGATARQASHPGKPDYIEMNPTRI